MITIRENIGMPPGGFRFQDPRVPAMIWDDLHTFMDERVSQVIKFRLGNPRIYDQQTESQWFHPTMVRQEIASFNCLRLNNDPVYCYDASALPTQKMIGGKKCDCNVALEPRYCPTCSSQRLIGYKCPACGALYDL